MTMRQAGGAALVAATLLAACQTGTVQPRATAMDGEWASADGIFIATFERGSFTSRFIQTNEILAQGTYAVSGSLVSLRWLSVQAQEQRAATCTFATATTVRCQQEGGGAFDLLRTA